jgi:hypothetical protein
MRRLTAFLPGTEAVGVVIAVGGKITRFPSKPRRKDENIVDLINALKRSIANDREAEAARSRIHGRPEPDNVLRRLRRRKPSQRRREPRNEHDELLTIFRNGGAPALVLPLRSPGGRK